MKILVLDGNENQAVSCVRSLSRLGHQVTVGSEYAWSKAGLSRHARGTFRYPDPSREAIAFVQAVAATAAAHQAQLVLPLTERTLQPVSEHRGLLEAAGATVVLPDHATVLRTTDKAQVLELASGLGISIPRTLACTAATSPKEIMAACGLPLVLKARSSVERAGQGVRVTGAPVYVSSRGELEQGIAELTSRCESFVAQEFVRGDGVGYFALCDHGHPVLEFAHRRLRDVRPSGSGSSLRESIPIPPALRDAGRRLLAALQWHGPAMVEFKVDGERMVLMEVNGRFWGSLALAELSGCDFPGALAALAAGEAVPASRWREGVKVRWLVGDLQHLAAVLRGPPVGFPGSYPGRLQTIRAVLLDGWRYRSDNFEWRDPLPEFGDLVHFVMRRLPRYLGMARG